MKNLYLRTIAICLFLLAFPMTQYGQQPKFAQNETTIDFNITDIARFDERIFFIYNLLNDSRFNVVNSEEDGVFIVSANASFEDMDLKGAFADFKAQNAIQFSKMNKEQATETALDYKSQLSQETIHSLMMDIYIESRQNNLCATADPFCTDNGLYQFPAGVNAGSGESGPNYDCLSTRPNPAWYYMRIANPGGINIYMYSTPSEDIDFCCWGPFDDPVAPCPNGLTSAKVVSCSYSTAATETCQIPTTAQTGQYYILVITNFSNHTCNITFSKTSGNGTTDCSIMPPAVSNGGPYCVGQTIQLNAIAQTGASYSWTGPGGFTSTLQNPTRPNCTQAMNGIYTCTIHVGSQSNSDTTNVVVNANPVANAGEDQTTAYPGATAQLHGSGGAGSFNYHWEPADKIAVQGQNATTIPLYADQQFTLTVTNPQGNCSSSDQMTVHIGGSAMTASASASEPDICQGNSTQLQANAGGGSGSFSYSWSPTNSLNQSNIYNPVATPSQTTTYTCHVTDVGAQTTQDVSVIVYVHNSISVQENATICQGESYNFHGNLCSVAGDYNYTAQTQYGCDSIITLHLSVNPSYTDTENNENFITHAAICPGESYVFHGDTYSTSGKRSHTLHTVNGCDSIVWLDLLVYPEHELTIDSVTICHEQLPYTYHGVTYNQAATDIHTFEDIHSCDSIVKLVLTVSQYALFQEEQYIAYNSSPSYTWPANGQTYTAEGTYIDTLPTQYCEGIFTLKLHFMQAPDPEITIDTSCNLYNWEPVAGTYYNDFQVPEGSVGKHFTKSHYVDLAPYHFEDGTPCRQEYRLELQLYRTIYRDVYFDEIECDSVSWQFGYNGETYTYYNNDVVTKSLPSVQSHFHCDSIVTLHITNMMYTPKPEIVCQDNGVAYPHHPITSTEFIISQYNYTAVDPKSEVTWLNSQCKWEISKDSWPIEPSADNRTCTVYALDWVQDTVWLSFTAYNPCSTKGVTTKYYLKPSFYGIQEQEAYPAAVEIFPNPNNGNMRLHFDNIEGRLDIKVFSSTGVLADNFQVTTNKVGEEYEYSMKRFGNGIYFFVITDGKRSVTKKVVIIN